VSSSPHGTQRLISTSVGFVLAAAPLKRGNVRGHTILQVSLACPSCFRDWALLYNPQAPQIFAAEKTASVSITQISFEEHFRLVTVP